MIRVSRLSHKFGAKQVLSDVGLKVEGGQIFGFIGPNGAGKTTTIRALATLLVPDEGEVEICGVDAIAAPTEARRKLGLVPDTVGVYERLTVREYLEFFAAATMAEQGPSRRRAADAALELTGMTSLSDRLCSELSKGVRQRLVLARALVHDPPVLLLDEPASGLDPRARIELFELLKHLQRAGKAILISSHILAELASVATHVGIIEAGRMVATGPTKQIADMLGQDRVVLLRLLEPAAGRGEALRRLDGVVEVIEREPTLLAVTIRGDEREVAIVVKSAVEAGLLVTGVSSEWTDLEKIFLVATRGEVQ